MNLLSSSGIHFEFIKNQLLVRLINFKFEFTIDQVQ